MNYEKVARVYRKIRDKRAELKREFEAQDHVLRDQLEQLEHALLNEFNESGSTSVKTDSGIIFTQEELKASVADWGAYVAWMRENDAFEMVQKRPAITEVRKYMDEYGDIPPGLNIHRQRVIRIRKS